MLLGLSNSKNRTKGYGVTCRLIYFTANGRMGEMLNLYLKGHTAVNILG